MDHSKSENKADSDRVIVEIECDKAVEETYAL
jgi:hypothetical protein